MKGISIFACVAVLTCGCASNEPTEATRAPALPRDRQTMQALGQQYATASDLYQGLLERAGGGTRLSWSDMPDWTGLWTWKPGRGFAFDPDMPEGVSTTAKLTPEFQRRFEQSLALLAKGLEYDPISSCAPPGFPRWLAIPFLREHIVTPDQTWLTSETVNNVRRIYTDGRGHMAPEDRYPLYYGDSVGFWNDQKALTIHTDQLRAGIYQRGNPEYTDEVETVEIWQKVDDSTIEVDVWVYDPPALVEPWYVRQRYSKIPNDDRRLRIHYWDCGENQNNAVYQTPDGGTQFRDFTFTETDNR